jgi:glucosamine kinase
MVAEIELGTGQDGRRMNEVVLGIDGGGSKTLVMLADRSGHIARTARTGGINPLDNPSWRRDLEGKLRPLAATPGIVAAAAALPAHGEVEAISEAQREAVASVLAGQPQLVLNDVDGAQIGAFAGEPGILILSGTGSMAWARDIQGQSHRVGGWGDVVGDEGSGHWIGHEILGLVSQSLDGRADPTGLVDAVFTHLGLDRTNPADALEGWVSQFSHPRSEIAALAPLATQLAEAGDAGALAIVEAAAHELARHVRAIERKMGATLPWSYAGGTLGSRFLLAQVAEQIGRPPIPPRLPPIGGALLAAARLAGWPVDDNWIERIGAAIHDISADQKPLQLTTT